MMSSHDRRAQHKNRNPIQRRQFGSPFQVGDPDTPGITPEAPVTSTGPEIGNSPAVEPVDPTPTVVATPPPAVTPSTTVAPIVPAVSKTPDAVVATPSTPPVVAETPSTPPVVENTPAAQPTSSTPIAPVVTPTPSSTPPINLQPVETPTPSATPPTNPLATNRSVDEVSTFVTATRSINIAAASGSPSSSSLPENTGSSAISGGTIGGILGGLFGIALLTAIIGFLIRKFRSRKQKGDADGDFNPMADDDVPGPGMVERRMNMTSPGPGPSYGATSAGPNFAPQAYSATPHGNYGGNNDQYGSQYAVGNNNYDAGSPHNYAHDSQQTFQSYEQAMAPANGPQFVNYGAIGGSPLSPVGPYDTYDLPATPGTAVAPGQYLSRQPSTGLATPGPYGQSALSPADPNYVDLSRSSVSPFQAQQYAEIHARLGPTEENMPVPAPAHFNQQQQPNQRSPFGDDDDDEAQYAAPQYAIHNRIDSIPPSLPNISVEEAGNDSFSPASFNFPGGVATGESPVGGAFPKSPLPNATFSANGHSEFDHAPAAPAPAVPTILAPAAPLAEHGVSARPAPSVPATKRPETVYDDEDPYGGI